RLRPDLAPALVTHLSRDDAPAAHYELDGHVAIGAVRYELALADQFVNARDAHARLTDHLHHGGFRIISHVVAHQAVFLLFHTDAVRATARGDPRDERTAPFAVRQRQRETPLPETPAKTETTALPIRKIARTTLPDPCPFGRSQEKDRSPTLLRRRTPPRPMP